MKFIICSILLLCFTGCASESVREYRIVRQQKLMYDCQKICSGRMEDFNVDDSGNLKCFCDHPEKVCPKPAPIREGEVISSEIR